MSRIGKKSITVPSGVTTEVVGNTFAVKGPKGEQKLVFDGDSIEVLIKDNIITLKAKTESSDHRAKHGLYRSLFANLIEGVDKSFCKSLEIRGVGYKLAVNGQTVDLSLGHSHPIKHELPLGVTGEISKDNILVLNLTGIDKQMVGQEAAKIRSYRKPEPYKGKGIRYLGEHIAIKAGKSASK